MSQYLINQYNDEGVDPETATLKMEKKMLENDKKLEANNIRILKFLAVIIIVGSIGLNFYYTFRHQDESVTESSIDEESEDKCSVMAINVHGHIATYDPYREIDDATVDQDVISSEEVVSYIERAGQDEAIKAVILEVDSYGGTPVAGEEIANALKRLDKPSVAFIRQSGASAAYWAASGAGYIIASANSDIGSIGVTSSYLDNVGQNTKDGNNYIQLSSGKYKDAGDPDRPLTDEEKAIFMRDLKIVHKNFIEAVATNRKLSIPEVEKIADGSTVLGARAKELKLIDEIGDLATVTDYLHKQIGDTVNICWQ
jgi:protease-4